MEMPSEEYPKEGEVAEVAEEAAGTASLPRSLFGESLPKVGETVTLEIRGVDDDEGTVTVSYGPSKPKNEPRGIEALAAKFD